MGSKLRVAVEVEVVIISGEAAVLEVVLEVLEVNVLEVEECVCRRGGGSTGRSERE